MKKLQKVKKKKKKKETKSNLSLPPSLSLYHTLSQYFDICSSVSDNWVELRHTHVELSSRNVKPHDVLMVRHIRSDAAHNWNRKTRVEGLRIHPCVSEYELYTYIYFFSIGYDSSTSWIYKRTILSFYFFLFKEKYGFIYGNVKRQMGRDNKTISRAGKRVAMDKFIYRVSEE